MGRVFERMTDIPQAEIEEALHAPQLSLFVFQFADYAAVPRDVAKVF